MWGRSLITRVHPYLSRHISIYRGTCLKETQNAYRDTSSNKSLQTLAVKISVPQIGLYEKEIGPSYTHSSIVYSRFRMLSSNKNSSEGFSSDYSRNYNILHRNNFQKLRIDGLSIRNYSSLSSALDNAAKNTLGVDVIINAKRYYAAGGNRGGFNNNIHNRITSLQVKKRVQRKKKQIQEDVEEVKEAPGFPHTVRHRFLTFDPDYTMPEIQVDITPRREWQVTAYATADEYNLDKLILGLTEEGLYTPSPITSDGSTEDVIHAVASFKLEPEHRAIYFFKEGAVVFWNVGELERANVLRFIESYQEGAIYNQHVVQEECESLPYRYSDVPVKTKLVRDKITLNPEGQTDLEKYTFSNVLAMSVKLGIWEASLDTYIDNIEYVSEELSKTGKVVLSQGEVLQRLGQLCALRHLLNLSSDLLDVPDFYWEYDEMEQLYKKTSDYLSVTKRTSVMNVKLNHCIELMELLKSHLNEQHSSRLEWIIIILIMVEVAFELLHFLERIF